MGLEFTDEMITKMVSYVGLVFSDLSNLILLIVGVLLGVVVIGAIISSVRGH